MKQSAIPLEEQHDPAAPKRSFHNIEERWIIQTSAILRSRRVPQGHRLARKAYDGAVFRIPNETPKSMLTDAPPRKSNLAGFQESDLIDTLDLPSDFCLPAIITIKVAADILN
jgi:hypothetical protein